MTDPLAPIHTYLARPGDSPFPVDALAQLRGAVDPRLFLRLLVETWRHDQIDPCGREERLKILVVEAIVRTRCRAPEVIAELERLLRETAERRDDGGLSPSPDHNERVLDTLRAARDLHTACEAALRALRRQLAEDDECEAMERAAKLAADDAPVAVALPGLLAAAAGFRAPDYFWERAFEAAAAAGRLELADRIMRDHVQTGRDYTAPPHLTAAHARVLEALGRHAEALTAIRAAIDDLPFDEALLAAERRIYAALRARR